MDFILVTQNAMEPVADLYMLCPESEIVILDSPSNPPLPGLFKDG